MPTSGRHRITRLTVKKRMVGTFTERLPLKFAALFFSLVLWLIVAAEEPAARELEVKLALTTDSLVRVADALPDVHALVVGSGRDLLKLYATPPTIRRHFGNDSPETVVLDVRPADVDLPNGVSARVQDVQPRSIPLRLDVRATRMVPVRSALRLVSPPAGTRIAGAPRFEPESVLVTGRRTSVAALDSVLTVRTELSVQDTSQRRVALDTAGLGVRVIPAVVRVTVPLARLDAAVPTASDTSVAAPDDTLAQPRETQDTARGAIGDSAPAATRPPAPDGRPERADSAPLTRPLRPRGRP